MCCISESFASFSGLLRAGHRLAITVAILFITGCRPSTGTFVQLERSQIALTNVEVVDGTGAAPRANQTVLIDADRIRALGPAQTTSIPAGFRVLDLRGHTVIPGLVGMHDHLFYAVEGGRQYISARRNFAHLYLAAGVTSIRTAGTNNVNEDAQIKREIDEGREAGPRIHLTSEYLGRQPDLESLARRIDDLANRVTSLKVYTDMRRDELATTVAAAHRRGLKVTGHLCAVGFRQAAAMGIDNLEHGIVVDSEFNSQRIPDRCPDWGATVTELATMTIDNARIQQTILDLVERRVAVTSTLAVFESMARPRSLDQRLEPLLTPTAFRQYEAARQQRAANPSEFGIWEKVLRLEMAFERAFAGSGGLLMAGADPTGWGGVIAGYGDQRNVELLVEAGFNAEQAIRIATANGAEFLGQSDLIGTVSQGKQADLVVVRGSLASDIRNIRNVQLVFKGGVGFDAARLIEAEHGRIGG